MALELCGQPLIDRDDFEELAAAGIFGRWLDQARCLREQGFCLLPLEDADFARRCQQLKASLADRLKPEIEAWHRREAGPPRLQDGWRNHDGVRQLCLLPSVLDLLQHLYGREPIPFQSLNFAIGSQQPVHSDAVHFHAYPHGFMCGVWIALEDVLPDSGPLMYYPGSHRRPYLCAEDLGLTPEAMRAEQHPQKFFQDHWEAEIERQGLCKHLFHPRCGEILIWHANLLHGGEAVVNPDLSRWSQVNHYYFADCLYTTPFHSYAASEGGATLRNPYNIASQRRIFSEAQWRDLNLHPPEPSATTEPDPRESAEGEPESSEPAASKLDASRPDAAATTAIRG